MENIAHIVTIFETRRLILPIARCIVSVSTVRCCKIRFTILKRDWNLAVAPGPTVCGVVESAPS